MIVGEHRAIARYYGHEEKRQYCPRRGTNEKKTYRMTTEDILLSDHPARRRNVEFTEVHWNPDKNPVGKTSNAMSRQPVNIKRNFFFSGLTTPPPFPRMVVPLANIMPTNSIKQFKQKKNNTRIILSSVVLFNTLSCK